MTKTHTGLCGIKGCSSPTDWDVGPGLCQFHWESYTSYAYWEAQHGIDASVEMWLEAEKLAVGV